MNKCNCTKKHPNIVHNANWLWFITIFNLHLRRICHVNKENRMKKLDTKELNFCARIDNLFLQNRTLQKYLLPDRMSVIFLDCGEAVFSIDDNRHTVNSSQVVILRPRQQICLESISEGSSMYVIGFMPALQDVVVKNFSIQFFSYIHNRPVWTLDERTCQALMAFYDLYEYNCNVIPGQFTTEIANSMFCIFMQAFYQLVKKGVDAETVESGTVTTRTMVGRFFRLMQDNYKLHHNVMFYSDSLCVSSKYLSQVVKSFANHTPKELIDRRLGLEALFMLTKSDKNVQEIANALGFPDQSYFGRFFKRLFGMSPLYYRQNPDLSLMENLR